MGGFSTDWLSLREPVDHRARDAVLLRAALELLAAADAPTVVDLAAGLGSTVRAMPPVVRTATRWILADHDDRLLVAARARLADDGVASVETRQVDLATGVPAELLASADLVTTSAFLDLVSAEWIDGLCEAIVGAGVPFYAALSYDGRTALVPPHADDRAVIAAVNRHQRTDKGFGPALGPDAAAACAEAFRARGYGMRTVTSDWLMGPEDAPMQLALIDGWAGAARGIGDPDPATLKAWSAFRTGAVARGVGAMMVGHIDLLATPPAS